MIHIRIDKVMTYRYASGEPLESSSGPSIWVRVYTLIGQSSSDRLLLYSEFRTRRLFGF